MKTSLTKMEDRRENIDFTMQQIIKVDRSQEEIRENLRKRSMEMNGSRREMYLKGMSKLWPK